MMFIFEDGPAVIDDDLREFKVVLRPLAREIEEYLAPEHRPVADSAGYCDAAEHLVGTVFVAAQVYMAAIADIHRLGKNDVLVLGPRHAGGRTLASLLNDGGNYWKHQTEWDPDETRTHRSRMAEKTMEAFDCLSEPTEWLLAGLLHQIVGNRGEGSILELVGVLEEWRDEVFAKHPKQHLPKAWRVMPSK